MPAAPLREALARVDALRADLDAMRPLDPDRLGEAVQRLRLEWTYHSNAIEGNALTYGETRALLLHGVTASGKPLKDHLDIRGHRAALDYLEAVVQSREVLTLAAVRELHTLLLGEPYETPAQTPDGQPTRRTVRPGEFKTMPNHVATATGETHYYARPEDVPARMGDLVDRLRAGLAEVDAGNLHPVVLAAEVHHAFAAIHPFDDGNGRMARLLMNLVLMRAGLPPAVLRQENRPAYYGALAAADGGEPEPFARFVADELAATMALYLRALRGEPDPDVFTRRLSILRREMESEERTAAASPEVIDEAMSRIIAPMIRRLDDGLNDLAPLYRTARTSSVLSGRDGSLVRLNGTASGAVESGRLSSLNQECFLSGHRYAPSESVRVTLSVSAGSSCLVVTSSAFDHGVEIEYTLDTGAEARALEFADRVLLHALDETERIAREAREREA